MMWHEIINQEIQGDPVLITYCPLCAGGIAFDRRLDDKILEFGNTGKLYQNNMVMYDRNTGSRWSQVGGRAIVGELTGSKLTAIPIDTVVWREWKEVHPDSLVLSQNTGHSRPYGRDQHGGYYGYNYQSDQARKSDGTLHTRTFVYGIEVNDTFRAYPEFELKEVDIIEDTIGGKRIRLERHAGGLVTVTNLDSGEKIVPECDFWFAWLAFHPETDVYEK